MKTIASIFLALCCASSFATVRYVATTGVDTDPGTFSNPYKTITKAISVAVPGDTIYVRGGTHAYAAKINIASSKVGTAGSRYWLLAYPNEKPILDFSSMPVASTDRGLQLSGNYWVIKGFDFYKAKDNGMHIAGAYNIVELCNFYENADSGLQLANGANNNQVINCDSYFNRDASDGNADGFAAKLDVGTGNSFKGCRAWQNSDDGWDGLLNTGIGTNPATTYDSCWCFLNGYLKSGAASVGNGNGFKMGGNNEKHDATLTRCLSAFNRVKGFDQNNNNGSMLLYNCTGYKNNPNFGMNNNDPSAGEVMVVKNCVSFSGNSSDVFRAVCTRTNNSWQAPVSTTAADFITVDSIGLRGPRKADGSLPDINFMHLVSGSDLINAGTDIGLPFKGTAPDLGAFETDYALPVTLLSFTGFEKDNTVLLSWVTATELQNKGWEIERAAVEGNNNITAWQNLGFINGRGNSTAINNYSFTDAGLIAGTTYQYRLKQIDTDGHVTYSPVVIIKIAGGKKIQLAIYPNPVKTNATIRYTIAENSTVKLSVFNAQGQLVKTILNQQLNAGNYSQAIETSTLAAGKYLLKIDDGKNILTRNFIKE